MANTILIRRHYYGNRWIEYAYPIYGTSEALKLVLKELRSLKVRYKVIYKRSESAYINVLMPRGDYIMEIRVSNHTKRNRKAIIKPFRIYKGYLLATDIHTYESLEFFLLNFKNFIK